MTGIEILLAVVLLLTNAYWAYQVQTLLNKLMSRNYHEFKVADLQKNEKTQKIKKDTSFNVDDMGQLQELM